MCKIRVRRAAPLAAALMFGLLTGCQPEARSEPRVRMISAPKTTAAERPVRTADPIRALPRQAETPVAAPAEPSKPADADSAEDRHPSRWPKKLRAKFAMVIDY